MEKDDLIKALETTSAEFVGHEHEHPDTVKRMLALCRDQNAIRGIYEQLSADAKEHTASILARLNENNFMS